MSLDKHSIAVTLVLLDPHLPLNQVDFLSRGQHAAAKTLITSPNAQHFTYFLSTHSKSSQRSTRTTLKSHLWRLTVRIIDVSPFHRFPDKTPDVGMDGAVVYCGMSWGSPCVPPSAPSCVPPSAPSCIPSFTPPCIPFWGALSWGHTGLTA